VVAGPVALNDLLNCGLYCGNRRYRHLWPRRRSDGCSQSVILGFVLFRIFDILKPWPISWLDKKVSGGFGIMIDDVIAGLAAAAVIYILDYVGLIL
jgi:hypothetical protein